MVGRVDGLDHLEGGEGGYAVFTLLHDRAQEIVRVVFLKLENLFFHGNQRDRAIGQSTLVAPTATSTLTVSPGSYLGLSVLTTTLDLNFDQSTLRFANPNLYVGRPKSFSPGPTPAISRGR